MPNIIIKNNMVWDSLITSYKYWYKFGGLIYSKGSEKFLKWKPMTETYSSLNDKVYIYIYIYIYIHEVHTISFQTFVVWALLLIIHTWNSSPLRSNLLQLQCTCTISTTSGRPHWSPLEGRVNDLHHSLFHLLNCLITTAFELRE